MLLLSKHLKKINFLLQHEKASEKVNRKIAEDRVESQKSSAETVIQDPKKSHVMRYVMGCY